MPSRSQNATARGLAAVLAADADLEVGARPPAQLAADLDQLADAVLVEHLERIVRRGCRCST